MAYRNKPPRQLTFGFGGLSVENQINPLPEIYRGSGSSKLPVYPQLGGAGIATNIDKVIPEEHPENERLAIKARPTHLDSLNHPPKIIPAANSLYPLSSPNRILQDDLSRRLSVDTSRASLLLPPSSPRTIPDSTTPVASSPATSERLVLPPKPKRGHSGATLKFAAPESPLDPEVSRGLRSQPSQIDHDKNRLDITPTPAPSATSRLIFPHHSSSSTPTSDVKPSLFLNSPTRYRTESFKVGADSALNSPVSYLDHRANSIFTSQQLESSVSSPSRDLTDPTPSSASLSTASRTSIDPTFQLASPAFTSPWPVPPSSAHSHAPFQSGWPNRSATYYPLRAWSNAPKKSATYYPLRTLSNAPRPDPSIVMASLSPLSTALAYLDLSSQPMSVPEDCSGALPQSPSLGPNSSPPSTTDDNPLAGNNHELSIRFGPVKASPRPASLKSHKSTASRDTSYEDALTRRNGWRSIAAMHMMQTEARGRTISQRLSLLNGIEAVNLAAEAKNRYLTESHKSQDLSTTIYSIPGNRTSYSMINHRHLSLSTLSTDLNSTNRDSYGSSNTTSSSRSHLSSLYQDFTPNSSRTSISIDHRLPLGGVPLFTRTSISREDREDDELDTILETPDLERAESQMPNSSLRQSGSHRRRLKPLILRTTAPPTSTSRKRTSAFEPYSRNSLSPSPPQPVYEANSSHVSNAWGTSRKSSDVMASKDPAVSSTHAATGHPKESNPLRLGNASTPKEQNALALTNKDFREAIDEHNAIKFPKDENVFDQATPPAKILEIPVIKMLSERSGTFGINSSKQPLYDRTNLSDDMMNEESRITLIIEDGTPMPAEHRTSLVDSEGNKIDMDNSRARKASPKGLNPIKTSMLESVRRRVNSYHSLRPGTPEDITLVNPSTSMDSPSTPKSTDSIRKRCISNLCMPKDVRRSTERGISPSNYAAAKLAERPSSGSTFSSGPKTPDTLVITSPPVVRPPGSDGSSTASTGSSPSNGFSGLAEATLTVPHRKSRLFMSLTRMEAQDAKLLDITKPDDTNSVIQAQSRGKLVKGKLKRISMPSLLHDEDERLALWGMISNAKLKSHGHK
ncbi:hypothetical protein PSHT_15517 [Puccinia striiformis]|uniref:Uncharacterized protein n=1 Tax=Puccinia striiformis TaxID=27350 RepID=A0A2S4UEJ2_9BASI|nr:hypothetical protein PSHT_15517 [Puccinia striiformis]